MKYSLFFLMGVVALCGLRDNLFARSSGSHPAMPGVYQITLDLAGCKDDKVKVTVFPPPDMKGDRFCYVMPRSVPGTYSKDDYGRFVMDAKAWDKNGHEIGISRDDNDIIVNGKPARLEYWVRDTWDDPEGSDVFQPTGSNIQKDTNFVVNTHAFFGYFEGYKMLPYQITVTKPKGFYGATSLDKKEQDASSDLLFAKSYPHLVDNPVMYCLPDTTSFDERGTKVMVAVYAPNKRVTSAVVAKDLKPVVSALGKFLGTMPVDRYTFIIYFAASNQQDIQRNFAYGALEHSYSSCYFLPEGRGGETTTEMIATTSAHEFLHILVPLNLHSKEVHDFNFKNPKMSQHLWLYEGCTEYFSVLARGQDTLLSPKQFFRELNQKMKTTTMMTQNKPLSLVTLSKKVLEPENQKIYPIIYEKGAVVGFLLDVRIRELTQGKMDLLGMIRKLTEKYGPHRPFDDDELFAEIQNIVHPDIKQFFDDYVIGDKELPYQEYFAKVGYAYKETDSVKSYQFNRANIFFSRESADAVVLRVRSENDFGVKDGDTLVRVNNVLVTPENKIELFGMYIWAPSSDKPVTLNIRRNKEELRLSAAPVEKMKEVRNTVLPLEHPTPEQRAMRAMLLKKEE